MPHSRPNVCPLRYLIYGLLLLLAIGPVAAVPAVASGIQSLDSIREAVRTFLLEEAAEEAQQDLQVTVGQLDPRLRLQACDTPLETFFLRGGRRIGNVTVGVECNGTKPWSLYVQAKVQMMADVVVARRPLPRGSVITLDDVALEKRDLSQLNAGYLTDLERVVGMTLKHAVRAGLALTPTLVDAPVAIRRGQTVTILARQGGLEVRMEGEALADGAVGELIRVRNRSSELAIQAEVIAPGVVQVRM